MNVKVLIIDTDRSTPRLLSRADFQICTAERKEVIKAIDEEHPDILLLEYADAVASIRQHWAQLPIIVLIEGTQERSIAQILDSGADDCVVKPFGPAELGARMRTQVRRARSGVVCVDRTPCSDLLCSGDGYIRMFVPQRQVFVGGQLVRLTKIEFDLLQLLMSYAEKVLTHRILFQHVWGANYGDEDDSLRVYIRQIRCKIEPVPSNPQYILTEPRVGYVFRARPIVLLRPDSQQFASL